VLMTGLTVVNDTLEAVIRRTPSARLRIINGPTVPASPAFFDYGIDVLGITQVDDVGLMSGYACLVEAVSPMPGRGSPEPQHGQRPECRSGTAFRPGTLILLHNMTEDFKITAHYSFIWVALMKNGSSYQVAFKLKRRPDYLTALPAYPLSVIVNAGPGNPQQFSLATDSYLYGFSVNE